MYATTQDIRDNEPVETTDQTLRLPHVRAGTCADRDRAEVRAAQADPAAFAALYERYFDAVYRYCRYRCDHLIDAEDAASTTFIRALAAPPRFDPQGEGTFRSWLFSIANRHRDRHRDRKPTQPLDDGFAGVPNDVATPTARSP